MEIKLDNSILEAINQNYKIDPSILMEVEQRRQTSEAVNSSIKDIIQNAPTAPPSPKSTDSVTDQIINNSSYEYTLKDRQLKSILDLISLTDANIDKTDEIIQKIDGKIVTLINEINQAITEVKVAYDAKTSIGCVSNLIWKNIGKVSGYNAEVGAAVTFSNYIVTGNSNNVIIKNYYGLKYYQKPSNRDYGFTIISEFNGSILVGTQTLTVLGVGGTAGIQIGDEITDNLKTPTAFSIGNLPMVVGFGTTNSVGINTTIFGNVSSGSNLIAYTGTGSTSSISIGDYVYNPNIFDLSTKVTGFSVATIPVKYYDTGLSTLVTKNIVVPSIILDKVSISSVTNGSFGFGNYIQYNSLLLSTSSISTVENKLFTVIRRTEDITQNFSYTNNPSDPITIGIINNSQIGVGNQIEVVNNGEPSGPEQWKKALDEPEPNIGAGNVSYYPGQALWPYETIVGYASEGNVYTFPENTIPSYTTISPVGLGSTSPPCIACSSNITLAEANLQSILDTNLPEIQKLVSASIPLRSYRDEDESKAWSYLQSASYLRSNMVKIQSDINSLKSFDYNSL